ncbi:MAG: DNA-binding Lrp family transcriptional regulator [Verrucomicrobiales bacterium]|jgi:DNA-binding Lrp family transcriptional regulator
MTYMDPLLEILHKNAKHTASELAEMLALDESAINERVAAFEKDGTILGYQAILDSEKAGNGGVVAFIEVKLTPERGGGFDRLAQRISKFDQVTHCHLLSGSYDLLVTVEGSTLRDTARFVAEKLSTLDGVISTATHFQLKTYKQNGLLVQAEVPQTRLPVAP